VAYARLLCLAMVLTQPNLPPSLEQPADQASATEADVSLQLSGSDPEGAPLTYQATGLPPGATVNASTGLISGRLTNSAGVFTVTASVSDGTQSASRTFTWSVDSPDLPMPGDFDGDGRPDVATYRRATGEWRIWPSSTGALTPNPPIQWGLSTDVPVPADYDGDGRTDPAAYRPSNGIWYILLSTKNLQDRREVEWGTATDRPLPIDVDNDGRADLALVRPDGFEVLLSSTNYTTRITIR
jgi:hypothetical protein